MLRSWQNWIQTLLIAAVVILASHPARAVSILRDPDIEYALSQLAKPILNSAGLPTNGVRILVVKNNKLNAFIVDILLRLNCPDNFPACDSLRRMATGAAVYILRA